LGLGPGGYAMNNAMLRGVFDGDLAPRMTPTSCTSGNCTWPTFSSLGICSHCEDVTAYAQMHSSCSTYSTSEMEQMNCTINLPGSLPYPAFQLTTVESTATQQYPYMIVWPSNLIYSTDSENYGYLTNGTYAGVEEPLLPIAVVKVDPFSVQNITRADQCALSFCVKTYNESVNNGAISSTILSTWPGRYSGLDIIISPPADKEGSITSNRFSVDSTTARGVLGIIGTNFFGNLTVQIDAVQQITGHAPSSDIMDALNQTSDLYGLMESVATSMTNHIRSVSTVTVPGKMGTVETYVHVRWVWLTLPAVLIVSSAAFLALAILETRHKKAEVWKDSSLALIFHGLEQKGESTGVVNKLSDMEDVAKGMKVRLDRVDMEDWRLFRIN
jgi:hypothetical protein